LATDLFLIPRPLLPFTQNHGAGPGACPKQRRPSTGFRALYRSGCAITPPTAESAAAGGHGVKKRPRSARHSTKCISPQIRVLCTWGVAPVAPQPPEIPYCTGEEAGVEQHSNTAQHSTAAPGREGFDVALCISTGLVERQQWRLVAEGRQDNGMHAPSDL
jgi:hypothetical protein